MSTLSEIEAAVDKLPHPEQQILLEHLSRKLGARSTITEESRGATRTLDPKARPAAEPRGYRKPGVPLRRSSTISVVSVADELLDSSALVKLYVQELDSEEFRELALKQAVWRWVAHAA